MTGNTDSINADILRDADRLGYRLRRSGAVEGIEGFFYRLEHRATGARHFHIACRDMENTFGVALKTVPEDSTGVAHILEHTVLCGSTRYPVRDPFFSMLKRSLSTFMNAFTAADWTMYPFSTENRKDFYNLMDVYLDAVFFPKLERLSFKQEGHRLEIEALPGDAAGEALVYKGVVYNEMKGAMSSADQVMVRSLMNALYPDTTYHHNSGGDPAVIPRLTHEQLQAFHRRHYHPSNAYFYTYGNLPLAEHLAFISEKVLASFSRIDPRTDVAPQPRWDRPRSCVYRYPLSPEEDPSRKHQACVAWLTADIRDSFEVLVLMVLGHILLGNAASPLRKALIEAGMGTALSDGSGFDADNRDTLFACGLKDVAGDDAGKVEAIVDGVLAGLVEGGIEAELVESAIHQIEFHRKEVTNTPYPYGIKLLMAVGGTWMHGGEPERILNFDADLARLREALAEDGFLEARLKTWFVDNPHRVRFLLEPDPEMETRREREVAAELEARRRRMSPEELAGLQADARALAALQDRKEDLSVLPTLGLEDIPPSVKSVAPLDAGGAPLRYDQPTSGISYFSSAVGVAALPRELIPLVPFFCHALPRTGTRDRDYVEMARRIDACTGGVGLGANARVAFDGTGACLPFVSFNAKCLDRNQEKMVAILEELASRFDFSDRERLRNLLMEYRATLESMVVHQGHRLAISLASRHFSPAAALNEVWHGVHQVRFVKKLTEKLDAHALENIAVDLERVGRAVFSPGNMKAAVIGERGAVDSGGDRLAGSPVLSRLACPPGKTGGFESLPVDVADQPLREGWRTSSAVSFVASAFETVRMGHEDAPALAVAAKLLRSLYLHREIREKGGAYGGFAVYDPETGLFSFGSYRDPHILSTLDAYDRAATFIRDGSYGPVDVNEAILQVCSDIDKPHPPGPAARRDFYRRIISLTDDIREGFKKSLLTLTGERVAAAAEKYFAPDRAKGVAVISGDRQLRRANDKRSAEPLVLERI